MARNCRSQWKAGMMAAIDGQWRSVSASKCMLVGRWMGVAAAAVVVVVEEEEEEQEQEQEQRRRRYDEEGGDIVTALDGSS
jgi:hypothetical protein